MQKRNKPPNIFWYVHLLLELLREKVDGVDMGVTTGESSGFGVGGGFNRTGGRISTGPC